MKDKGKSNKSRPKCVYSIGNVTVTCGPGPMMGSVNVTVTATGVTCPVGSPATGQIVAAMATISVNGVQAASPQSMSPSGPGTWVTTFANMPPATYKGTVTMTWQIMDTESATSAPCAC